MIFWIHDTRNPEFTAGELVTVGATGFAANVAAQASGGLNDTGSGQYSVPNIGLFVFGENVLLT